MAKKDNTTRNAIIVIALIIAGLYAYNQGWLSQVVPPPPPPPEAEEWSAFKFDAEEKGSGTSITGATIRCWYDENDDGKMQYSELGRFSESSGTYTSADEYPIGADIWVQIYDTDMQLTYHKVKMSGQRNSDGSAKSIGILDAIETATFTYSGSINKVAWTASTDYNYTLSGSSGFAEVTMTVAAENTGLTSQIWEGVDYMYIYGGVSNQATKTHDYIVRWSEIQETGIPNTAFRAPTYLGLYMTAQDGVDLNPSTSYFDFTYQGLTNYYYGAFVSESWGQFFYYSTDAAAPRPTFTFYVDIDAAGTTVATYGTSLWQDITYDNAYSGNWGTDTVSDDGGWAWVA